MSRNPNQPQIVYVKQKGGCSSGFAIGLGIIAAIIFVVFILPAGCTIFAGKAVLDGVKQHQNESK
jgi:hypothetical protein